MRLDWWAALHISCQFQDSSPSLAWQKDASLLTVVYILRFNAMCVGADMHFSGNSWRGHRGSPVSDRGDDNGECIGYCVVE